MRCSQCGCFPFTHEGLLSEAHRSMYLISWNWCFLAVKTVCVPKTEKKMIGFPLYHCSKKLCLCLLYFYSKSLFVCMTFLAFQTNPQKYYPSKDKTMRLYWPCSQSPIRIILYHLGQRDYVPKKVHLKVTQEGSSVSACNKQKLLFSARCEHV